MAGVAIKMRVEGDEAARRAFERLARESPTRARAAVNRTLGVARVRVARSIANATGIPRRVLLGRHTRRVRATGAYAKGKGYLKLLKATRRRSAGALVALTEGVLFSRTGRRRLGAMRRPPGGVGQPFTGAMPSGHSSLFERRAPMKGISRDASKTGRARIETRRKNLPIRELLISIIDPARRAIRIHMRRAGRSVLPIKVREELAKTIRRITPAN